MENTKSTRDKRFIIPGALLLVAAALKSVGMFLTPGSGFGVGHETDLVMLWLNRISYIHLGLLLSVFVLMIVFTRKKRLVSWFVVALISIFVFNAADLIATALVAQSSSSASGTVAEFGLTFLMGVETCVSVIAFPSFAYGLYLLVKNRATRALFISTCAFYVVKLLSSYLPLARSFNQALRAGTSWAEILLFICFGLVLILMPPEKQIDD